MNIKKQFKIYRNSVNWGFFWLMAALVFLFVMYKNPTNFERLLIIISLLFGMTLLTYFHSVMAIYVFNQNKKE